MSRSFHYAIGFEEIHQKADLTSRCAQTTAASFWRTVIALRTMWGAFREGLAAHRQYEHLRSRGVPHDAAIKEALGVGRTPTQATRGAIKGPVKLFE